jgi:hypothetical protein
MSIISSIYTVSTISSISNITFFFTDYERHFLGKRDSDFFEIDYQEEEDEDDYNDDLALNELDDQEEIFIGSNWTAILN